MSREELRNMAAVAVLQAIVTRPHNLGAAEQFAHDAVNVADALVAVLEATPARALPPPPAEPRNCGTCAHSGLEDATNLWCHGHKRTVYRDMSCPDWIHQQYDAAKEARA